MDKPIQPNLTDYGITISDKEEYDEKIKSFKENYLVENYLLYVFVLTFFVTMLGLIYKGVNSIFEIIIGTVMLGFSYSILSEGPTEFL